MSELEQKCYNKAIAFKLAYSCCFSLEENPPPNKKFYNINYRLARLLVQTIWHFKTIWTIEFFFAQLG